MLPATPADAPVFTGKWIKNGKPGLVTMAAPLFDPGHGLRKKLTSCSISGQVSAAFINLKPILV
jgi:uncharacterized membrane protein